MAPHSDQLLCSVVAEEGVTTALLAKISQDERLHLTDQEGGTDESPTSTRNGAKMLVGGVGGRFKVEEGGNKGETRGRNHERRVLPLVNLSRIPAQPSFDFQPGFRETLLGNISP